MKEQPTLADVLLFRMKQLIEPNGTLMPVELNGEIPFEVKRTFFVTDVNAEDVLIAHTNGDAIREANASDSPSSKATEAVNSLISEEVEEETEEAEEMEEELDDSFEL